MMDFHRAQNAFYLHWLNISTKKNILVIEFGVKLNIESLAKSPKERRNFYARHTMMSSLKYFYINFRKNAYEEENKK